MSHDSKTHHPIHGWRTPRIVPLSRQTVWITESRSAGWRNSNPQVLRRQTRCCTASRGASHAVVPSGCSAAHSVDHSCTAVWPVWPTAAPPTPIVRRQPLRPAHCQHRRPRRPPQAVCGRVVDSRSTRRRLCYKIAPTPWKTVPCRAQRLGLGRKPSLLAPRCTPGMSGTT
ncbi:Piso0_003437 [Millerozyma farinosa CBS 7064]|uniref:Piso0_003437 protein n=1 Tax=Pichia sorbitophila (strain ATCC MYA-4447 / BCRC 22081 / CBS 7064 / NBRC 10061 / NRRL Y-12695) TaxID=559304 RepID=G8YI36_PICSO|nr:Piso0_003437 [Millerozyma farinosa CBS 7064]CCE81088.1 Piso0_003437 [Millerozyma farinosa CBS 7064]